MEGNRRRDFLKLAGSVWGSTLLANQIPAIALAAGQARSQRAFKVLSPTEAAELEAIAARIIPTTDTPGAREAGTFAMSSHGGNRDHNGWQILGFDHRHAWTPPFGYYDSQTNDSGKTHS